MKHRSVLLVVLLTLVTFGVYGVYWLESTRKELNRFGPANKIPSVWLLVSPLIILIALALLQFVAQFIFSTTANEATGAPSGTTPAVINVISVIAGLIAIVGLVPVAIVWMYRYCKGVEHVTGGTTSFGLSFGLWLITLIFNVYFVWTGVMQDAFNRAKPLAPKAPNASS